jgi:hypothetical protein
MTEEIFWDEVHDLKKGEDDSLRALQRISLKKWKK